MFLDQLQQVFRTVIPSPEDRITLTWNNAHHAFAYMLPVYFMSYLVRRRDTKVIRMALLPLILAMVIRGTFHYGSEFSPQTLLLSWMRGLAGFSAIALSLDCALSDTSRRKVEESSLPPMFYSSKDKPYKYLQGFADALEVQATFRGIGWNFGKGVYVPVELRNLEVGPFLWHNVLIYIRGFMMVDAVQAFFKYVPGLDAPFGTSIWNPNLPPVQRHPVWPRGELCFATIIGVGLFGQSPSSWPPVYDNPWKADSIHDFWAKRWHQLLRRVFVVLGGIPGQWLAGRVGAVMCTFIASGLFHELAFYLVDRGMDHRVTIFFALQGVGIFLEKVFTRLTGRRVGGWSGRVWVYLSIIGLGQICTDAWISRGLGHAISSHHG